MDNHKYSYEIFVKLQDIFIIYVSFKFIQASQKMSFNKLKFAGIIVK